MDNKNVFIAIALSMSVLLFWGAFFDTPKQEETKNSLKQIEKRLTCGNRILIEIIEVVKCCERTRYFQERRI